MPLVTSAPTNRTNVLLIHVVNTSKKKQFVDSYGSINFCKVSLTVLSPAGFVANKKNDSSNRKYGNFAITLLRSFVTDEQKH